MRPYQVLLDWLIISLFCGMLFIPIVLALIQPDITYSETEKRMLTPFPAVGADMRNLGGWTRKFDTYYQDHFGLRECLIHCYQHEMNKRFDIPGLPDVVEGKQGWLFYSGEAVLDDLRGRLSFGREPLNALVRGLEEKQAWFQRQGIQYLAVIAPNKQSIYPDFLPDFYTRIGKKTLLDQFISALGDKDPVLLDLRPPLRVHKNENRLYNKTGTHWNYLGAYYGYLDMMDSVTGLFPGFHFKHDFRFVDAWKKEPPGDLALMSGRRDTLIEMRPELVFRSLSAGKKTVSKTIEKLLPLRQFNLEVTAEPGAHLRAVVLHDSFFEYLEPFVSENFAEVLYIWKYYDEASMNALNQDVLHQVLQEFKPDLVIDEVVERHLPFLFRHDKPANKD